MRVLILDDSFIEREKIRSDVVATLGPTVEIDVAAKINEADDFLKQHSYDLGIFDVRLDEATSGIDFLKSLKKTGNAPTTVFLVSSYADEEIIHISTHEDISLLPKDHHEQSGKKESPLRYVLKSMLDPSREIFRKAFPGDSSYARQIRELLFYSKSQLESPTLISGPLSSGKTFLASSIIQSIYPKLNKYLLETFDCSDLKDQPLLKIQQKIISASKQEFPHLIIENINCVQEIYITEISKLIEKHLKMMKIIVTADSSTGWIDCSSLRDLFHSRIQLKVLSERKEDLRFIIRVMLDDISKDVIKNLTDDSFQSLTARLPSNLHELKTLLVQACVRSGINFYISTEHLWGLEELDPKVDLNLTADQYEKLNSFCRFIKHLKESELDQVDIYKYVRKLREAPFRSDFEKQYGVHSLPSRSTLNRILDNIKNSPRYFDIKNKSIEDISIHEIVSLRK